METTQNKSEETTDNRTVPYRLQILKLLNTDFKTTMLNIQRKKDKIENFVRDLKTIIKDLVDLKKNQSENLELKNTVTQIVNTIDRFYKEQILLKRELMQ